VPRRVATYLIAIFHAARPIEKAATEESRYLKRVAMCLDALPDGEVPHLGDLLVQRFKAMEFEAIAGSKEIANRLELIDRAPVDFASYAERAAASRVEFLQLMLEEAKQRVRKS
jgi:hypothetical protein